MKEKIYTVPVNDAFAADSECPVCAMFEQLENDAIEYTMGPSYMEDDIIRIGALAKVFLKKVRSPLCAAT